MLSVIWVAFLALALLCGAVTGRLDAVTAAVGTGASEAVTLAISIAGLMLSLIHISPASPRPSRWSMRWRRWALTAAWTASS